MIVGLDQYVLEAFLVFCRVGAVMMLAPGYSSARVPMRVRLFATLLLSPCIQPFVSSSQGLPLDRLAYVIWAEIAMGAVIGLICRIYVAALEFAGSAISNYIGLTAAGTPLEGNEPSSSVETLIGLTAVVILMLLDLHFVLLVALIDSYSVTPQGALLDFAAALRMLLSNLSTAFVLALQISAPFVIYALLVNGFFGILSRLLPQWPSYFISIPFTIMGGLFLMWQMWSEGMRLFAEHVFQALKAI